MAARQWSARGGPLILGKVVPGVVACIGLAALADDFVIVEDHDWHEASGPSVFLIAMVIITAWLVWKFLRTVWLIVLADDTFTFLATSARWTLGPGEIEAVRGDAYSQFLQIVSGGRTRIWIWGHLAARKSLFAAIRQTNPSVEFGPWIEPPTTE